MSDQDHQFNRRFLLRAFETTDAARVATILLQIGKPATTRDEIRQRWAAWRPVDAQSTGSRSVSSRMNRGLHLLSVAGVVQREDRRVVILDAVLLAMAARNLEILQDADGMSLPPSQWVRRPEAPESLRDIQDVLESKRLSEAS
jgi:hypothetical protein